MKARPVLGATRAALCRSSGISASTVVLMLTVLLVFRPSRWLSGRAFVLLVGWCRFASMLRPTINFKIRLTGGYSIRCLASCSQC